MQKVALTTPCFSEADAVSNDIRAMYELLLGKKHQVKVFAESVQAQDIPVDDITKMPDFLKSGNDVCMYHHSSSWPKGLDIFTKLKCRKVLRYHNITPASFFESINLDFVTACRKGRKETKELIKSGCDLFMADSHYNSQELIENGANGEHCCVVPPFHTIERLNTLEPDDAVLESLLDGRTNVLMVGRVAPNKGHLDLVEAFAAYYYGYNPFSRLVIVGKVDERLGSYVARINSSINNHGLQDSVLLTDMVSDEALKAYYLCAHVFCILSEHEGFCVPLVESMSMRVPIVASSSSAVPETLGEAGILWEEKSPELIAGSIHHLTSHEQTSYGFAAAGARRYDQVFALTKIEKAFLAALKGMLNK